MATYTSNINLKKPAQSDKIRIADFNTNADNIDAALGAGFGVSSAPSVNAEINSLADGLAIIANGNVHAAISSGQFVYVRGHGTLANGLYVANKNISANATLTSSDLDADSSGGLNTLSAKLPNVPQIGKVIYSGSISSSQTTSVSIPDLSKYNAFMAITDSSYSSGPLFGVRTSPDRIRFFGTSITSDGWRDAYLIMNPSGDSFAGWNTSSVWGGQATGISKLIGIC